MDPSDVYPDLLGQAASHSSQRLAQMGSLLASWAVVETRRRERRNATKQARSQQELEMLREQERAARKLARGGWAPALDRKWLAQADLLHTARAWSAAAAYADADPEAGTAATRSEERLRTLHPYAMAWYDRLRTEGAGRFDAMREAVPLFARAPHARPGGPAADRRYLTGAAAPQTAVQTVGAPENLGQPGPEPDPVSQEEQRGRQIVFRLQARAVEERGAELSPDELATVLGATTTLSSGVIARLARGQIQEQIAAGAERDRAFDLDRAVAAPVRRDGEHAGHLEQAGQEKRAADTATAHAAGDKSAAHLAAESFPCSAGDAVRAAGTAAPENGQARPRTLTAQNVRRPGLSLRDTEIWRRVMNALAQSPLFWGGLITSLALLYVLPTLIGIARKVEDLGLLVFINILPTGVGWIAALVMAFTLPRREPVMYRPAPYPAPQYPPVQYPPARYPQAS